MKNLFLFLLLFTFNSTSIFSQNAPNPSDIGTASITSKLCVKLNENEELKKFYTINISTLNFASEAAAKKAFNQISNNYLSYKVDFAHKTVLLKVHSNRTKTIQTVAWWNEYLASKCN